MIRLPYAEKVVVDELNSVNDNPVIDHKNENIFHGGNFHGDYVSLEMDKLKIAITKLSMLSEKAAELSSQRKAEPEISTICKPSAYLVLISVCRECSLLPHQLSQKIKPCLSPCTCTAYPTIMTTRIS
jgi:hypothetical protein